MFKLLYTNLAGPLGDINVSAGLVAEAGMVGYIAANATTGDPEAALVASSGLHLVGIIDDQKTSSFTATVIGEVVASGSVTLAHANIVAASETSVINSAAGTVTLTSATNGTATVTGIAPGATTTVNYSYVIPGKAGDDTTLASGKCTIWLQEGEYATDVYELTSTVTASSYSVGTPLYVSNTTGQKGRLTTGSGAGTYDSGLVVGYVTKAPTAGNPVMNFYKKNI